VPDVIKEFREFISRGNVIDLAVAVVVGTAFVQVVNAIVAGLITPLIGMIGGSDFSALDFTINGSTFEYGDVINAVIQFTLIAAAVFFLVVKPINVLHERRRRGQVEPEPEELSDEAALLTEIRDLLRSQAGSSS
jgi:large conductance mechanosensitive channel